MVSPAETCWCCEVPPAFTVQLHLTPWLCSSELGMWGWRSWSRGPAVLSELMSLIPTLSSPYSSYTDNLEFSRRWQQRPGLHCRDEWLDIHLGFGVVHNTGPNSPNYLAPSLCTLVGHLAPLVTHSPALSAVNHVPMACKLLWPTSHTMTKWPFLF